ncbi:EamA family transporter [Paracoccus cavernae]|uniref:EamA family transporter n=1 Tax=Paracoccus cavernae TaxID=1571207 RepID=UPI00362C0F22
MGGEGMVGAQPRSGRVVLAVVCAAGGAALAAFDAVIVRALAGGVHPFVIGFFRAAFGALAVLPLVIRRPQVLRTGFPLSQHALRAGLKLVAMVAFFAAFSRGALTDVTAIAFTSPVFVVLGAALVLGERLGPFGSPPCFWALPERWSLSGQVPRALVRGFLSPWHSRCRVR